MGSFPIPGPRPHNVVARPHNSAERTVSRRYHPNLLIALRACADAAYFGRRMSVLACGELEPRLTRIYFDRRCPGLSIRPASRPLGDVTNKAAAASSESAGRQQAAARPRAKLGDITNKSLPPIESLSICEPLKPQSFDRSGLDPDGCAAAALSLIAPCFGTPLAGRWSANELESLPSPQLLRVSESFVPSSPLLPIATEAEAPEALRQTTYTALPAMDEFCLPPAVCPCMPVEEKVPEELLTQVKVPNRFRR